MGAASSMLKLEGSPDAAGDHRARARGRGRLRPAVRAGHLGGDRGATNTARAGPDYAATVAPMYFNYRKTSIYAGSNEIQHNIMAKMVLGL